MACSALNIEVEKSRGMCTMPYILRLLSNVCAHNMSVVLYVTCRFSEADSSSVKFCDLVLWQSSTTAIGIFMAICFAYAVEYTVAYISGANINTNITLLFENIVLNSSWIIFLMLCIIVFCIVVEVGIMIV